MCAVLLVSRFFFVCCCLFSPFILVFSFYAARSTKTQVFSLECSKFTPLQKENVCKDISIMEALYNSLPEADGPSFGEETNHGSDLK